MTLVCQFAKNNHIQKIQVNLLFYTFSNWNLRQKDINYEISKGAIDDQYSVYDIEDTSLKQFLHAMKSKLFFKRPLLRVKL